VATLARLMPALPEFIDLTHLAKTRAKIAGELALGEMQRLRALLHSDSGKVAFHLDFARKNEVVCITGEFEAKLELLCQRCLQAFTTDLSNTIKTAIVASEAEIGRLGEDFEALIVPEKKLTLARLLEEELLLSMPLVATHALDTCPAEKWLRAMQVKKDNPFAVLKHLKTEGS